jgi:sulfotransferase family protein
MGDAIPVRIAMWSGPRNISTAMMRSFENRPDTRVVDEPFYAAYLSLTGIDHPMRDAVIAAGETNWHTVVDGLLAPLPDGMPLFYQKHMTHHMIPAIGRDWMDAVTNAFLIRRPENVLGSYVRKREAVTLEDIGFIQQGALFDRVADRLGEAPPVIDARDVLEDPEGILAQLCAGLGIPFSPAMLQWPAGKRDSDGVWGAHWYEAVTDSTGFGPPSNDITDLPDHLKKIADAARPVYERLSAFKFGPATPGRTEG